MSTTAFEFRWGIISTGKIAACFVKDLLVDPKTRNVEDVVHKVVAIGSRGIQKAQEFIDTVANGDTTIKAYGTYEEVYADKEVDGVYIGTPHTYHYVNALDALKAKKNVLCEKPVTSNAAELRSLIEVAKENNVFFMEAMWTRFQPLAQDVKRIVESRQLGAPVMLHADLSHNFDIQNIPKTHRILDPALGGGALLDLGPYLIVWAFLVLYENPTNNARSPNTISASMVKTPLTSVDSNTSFTLTFRPSTASGLSTMAVLSCSITLSALDPGVTIRFEHGNILISSPIYCPKEFRVQYFGREAGTRRTVVKEETKKFDYVGGGWHWQADEVARCVGLGKKESSLWSHAKSLLEMEIFDEVRRQGGYKLPEGVEKVL